MRARDHNSAVNKMSDREGEGGSTFLLTDEEEVVSVYRNAFTSERSFHTLT